VTSVESAEHANAQRMRDVADLLGRGEVAAALEHFSEEVVLFAPATRPEDRVYRGRDGLLSFFGRLQDRSHGTISPTVVDLLASDRHIVVFLRVTAAREGRELDVLVAHFATAGLRGFTRNWFLPSDLAAWNRFFR
jgi:ketosteroid isomerase-like protein